ncbi:MAG: PH domain-containing protein [Planctomycetota bacterium]
MVEPEHPDAADEHSDEHSDEPAGDATAAARADGLAATGHDPAFRAPDERLERRVVAYWYLTDLLRTAMLSAMLVVGAEYLHARKGEHDWLPVAAWSLAGLLLLLAAVVPPLAYARWRFAADDRVLTMRYGILFVEERLVPVPRMQHVDLTRGPIERLFGLATLVVFTAGNEGSAFRVPGLRRARAEALRDRILRARGRDVV